MWVSEMKPEEINLKKNLVFSLLFESDFLKFFLYPLSKSVDKFLLVYLLLV
jgi:hypothetical protein